MTEHSNGRAGPIHIGNTGIHRQGPLLDLDPDLGRGLAGSSAADARAALVVTVLDLPPGPWVPKNGADGGLGHLLLDGVALREVVVSGARSAEVLSSGDLIATCDVPDDALLDRHAEIEILAPARVAVLDEAFIRRLGGWPEVLIALGERSVRRIERLGTQHAIVQITRVDLRLEGLFWHLAERFGRITPDGVHLALRLPHRTLARLVGARRPSVTTALGQLTARGSLQRRPDGTWLLAGAAPAQLDGPSVVRAFASEA